MANLRNNAAIVELGSGVAKWQETDEDGSAVGSVYTLPWIKSVKLTDATDEVEIETDGEFTPTDTGKRAVTLELVVMQKDKATLLWHQETMRGKRVRVFKQISDKAIDGFFEYALIPICKLLPNSDIPIGKGLEMTWKFKVEPVDSEGDSTGSVAIDCSIFSGGFKKAITGSLTFASTGKQYYDILTIAE